MTPQLSGVRIPTVILKSAIPVPPPDNRVSQTGALVYFDPTHEAGVAPAGVGFFPNLVGYIASKVIGSSNIDDTRIGVRNTFGLGEGIAERTSKGALYIASSRTKGVADHVFQLLFTAAMKAWILANKSHMFYFTCSMRVIRPGSTGEATHLVRVGQNSGAYAVAAQEGTSVPSTSVSGLPAPNRTTSPSPGLMRISGAGRGQDNATNRPPNGVNITSLVDWFLSGGPLTAAGVNKSADVIFYDFYLEDLTLSGRSHAEVDAVFAAKHAQMHGAGGRYYGDTWRDPATIE